MRDGAGPFERAGGCSRDRPVFRSLPASPGGRGFRKPDAGPSSGQGAAGALARRAGAGAPRVAWPPFAGRPFSAGKPDASSSGGKRPPRANATTSCGGQTRPCHRGEDAAPAALPYSLKA